MPFMPFIIAAASENGSVLAGVVTSAMMNGVLTEVTGLLPATIPTMVSFIGLRKGISFVVSILHSA